MEDSKHAKESRIRDKGDPHHMALALTVFILSLVVTLVWLLWPTPQMLRQIEAYRMSGEIAKARLSDAKDLSQGGEDISFLGLTRYREEVYQKALAHLEAVNSAIKDKGETAGYPYI